MVAVCIRSFHMYHWKKILLLQVLFFLMILENVLGNVPNWLHDLRWRVSRILRRQHKALTMGPGGWGVKNCLTPFIDDTLRRPVWDLENKSRIWQLQKFNELGAVLANEGLLMVAGDVVSDDSVAVEVVQHGQTCLVIFNLKSKI